jgi:hypothetical protein
MRSRREVYLHEIDGDRRRSSRYRVEAPAELTWVAEEAECHASGWVLELDSEYATVMTNAELSVGMEIRVSVVLPPFGELGRILRIGFDATVEQMTSNADSNSLTLMVRNLVLTGDDEGQEESEEKADSAGN